MRPATRRTLAVALTALALLGACGGSSDDEDADDERTPATRDEANAGDDDGADDQDADDDNDDDDQADEDASGEDADEVDDGEGAEVGIDLEGVADDDVDDVIIEAALTDIEGFWATAFPETYGGEFQPVSGGHFPYGPDRDLPGCDVQSYDEIAQNAFYCPFDDLIAWDTDNLTNDLLSDFGPFSLVIVMAHEYGHAIQARVPVNGPTIATEQQADCFAGAYTDFVAQGGSDVISVSIEDLDLAMAGFLTLRDPVGVVPSSDPSAHGSAFDRVGAYQDGFINGAARCAEYEEVYANGGTTVTDILFTSQADFDSGGNAPLDPDVDDNIFDLALNSLEDFWTVAMPQQFDVDWEPIFPDDQILFYDPDDPSDLPPCGDDQLTADDVEGVGTFSCFGDPDDPDDDFVAVDVSSVEVQYDAIGDFAVAIDLSQEYAFAAQVLLGNLDSDRDTLLQADCFSGAWTGLLASETIAQAPTEERIQSVDLSAGDLDEAVQTFLLLGEAEGADETFGNPFLRLAAFRDGFRNGLESCAAYLDEGAPEATDDGQPEAGG